jgi:Raf kinase inhibitor-like YbhB/YbcL family protein
MKNSIKLAFLLPIFLVAFSREANLNVTSPAFSEGGKIPGKYSCEGAEVSPPLSVKDIPSGAKSLAIIVHDPDAPHPGGVTHWVAWNVPIDGTIPENFKGGSQGQNSDRKTGYKGMCPPTGTHRYNFNVYALDATLQLDSTTDKAALEAAMRGHILAQGVLMGRYSEGK